MIGPEFFREGDEAEAELRAEVTQLQAEIERLRELLREGLRPWPLAVSDGDGSNMRSWRDDWERRVREALGDAPDQRD